MHCRLSGAPPRHPTVRVREQSIVGVVVFLWHRTVWCHTGQVLFTVRCASDSACTILHCSSVISICSRPFRELAVGPLVHRTFRWHTGHSGGTPDSPVNYSGACLRKPESGCLDSVRSWCTRHCPVRPSTAAFPNGLLVVKGYKYPPNYHNSKHPKFLSITFITRALAFTSRHN